MIENRVIDRSYRSVKRSIYICAFATLLISSFWGLYFMAPASIKGIFSACMWLSILSVPIVFIKHNDFSIKANWLLRFLLIMAVLQILRSAFNTAPDMYAFGNKWFTLFGNEYTALLMMPPIFTYLGSQVYSVRLLKKVTYYYMAIGAVLSVFLNFPLSFLAIFVGTLFPYVSKKYKILIGLVFLSAIINASYGENPSRMLFIVLGFTLASYLLVYVIKKLIIIKAFVIAVTIAPLLLFIPMLNTIQDNQDGFFKGAQTYILGETGNEDLANDTRTFLYVEMASDLTKTDSWILGKGAFSHYYSFFFDEDSLGGYGRISSEVPVLNYLLRGGIAFVAVYLGLILLAVYYAVWKGKNKFVRSIGIIAIGWYFNSFIGDLNGCRFYHLAFFLLVGCCLSKKWLNYNDVEVKEILK